MKGVNGSELDPPRRLISDPGALGELLRVAVRAPHGLDQASAFERLVARARRRRDTGYRTAALALSFAALCLLVTGLALLGFTREPREPAAAAAETGESAPPAAPARTVLPAGESQLFDGTRVRVEAASSVSFEPSARGPRLSLDSGTLTLEVTKQPQGRTLEVLSKGYRFVVLGTVFSVSASAERVSLQVREGRVGVLRDNRTLAEVGAGETWTEDLGTAPAPVERVTPTARPEATGTGKAVSAPNRRAPEPPAPDRNCLALARERRPQEAEACFVDEAAGSGLRAEMALFELSRLRSDVLGDPAGALKALREHRARFPNGSLRSEVDVSYVHLLARLGRYDELLSESAALLGTATGRERRGELYMLRANTLRTKMKDYAAAEREYAAVERTGGKFAAEASYQRAVCLEMMGNTAAAAEAYRRYLQVAGRPREAEARRKLADLERR